VCRYDDAARGLFERLTLSGIDSVIIEPDAARAAALQKDMVPVVRAALDERSTFEACAFERARLLVANVDDVSNTNIVITAREVSEGVPIIAMVDDPDAMDILQLAGADHVVLFGKRIGEHLASRVSAGSARVHVVGRYKTLAIAEFPIRHTKLATMTLAEAGIRTRTGVTVAAIAKRGYVEPALPQTLLREDCIGIAVGHEDQLEALNEFLHEETDREGPVLVIGGGRVGCSTAEALRARGVWVRVIEENPELRPRITEVADDVVIGDAADHKVMIHSGINEAASVVLTTNNDATNIFLAVYCRKLNADAIIVSRVGHLKNIESIHRAGADFVVSDPQITIQSILSALEGREPVILGEGLDLFNVEVPRSLHGKMLRETGILARTGLTVIAVEREEVVDPHPRPETRLRQGERVLFIGTASQRDVFERVFG
jgi:voltage-gated potassium channel